MNSVSVSYFFVLVTNKESNKIKNEKRRIYLPHTLMQLHKYFLCFNFFFSMPFAIIIKSLIKSKVDEKNKWMNGMKWIIRKHIGKMKILKSFYQFLCDVFGDSCSCYLVWTNVLSIRRTRAGNQAHLPI